MSTQKRSTFMLNPLSFLDIVIPLGIFLLSMPLAFWMLLGFQRGFGFLDEGFYAASIELARIPGFATSFAESPAISLSPFLISFLIPNHFSYSDLKVYHFIYRSIVVVLFNINLWNILQTESRPDKFCNPYSLCLLVSCTLFWIFFGTCFGMEVFSYNHLTELLVFLGMSLVFLGDHSEIRFWAFGFGWINFLIFYAKPTALPLLGLCFFVYIFLFAKKRDQFKSWILPATLGAFTGLILGLKFIYPYDATVKYFFTRASGATTLHSPGTMVVSFLKSSFIETKEVIFYPIWVFGGKLFFQILNSKTRLRPKTLFWTEGFLIGLSAYLVYLLDIKYRILGFHRNYAAAHLLILFLMYLSWTWKSSLRLSRKVIFMLMFLFLCPFMCAIGTFNGFPHLGVFLTSWGMMLWLLHSVVPNTGKVWARIARSCLFMLFYGYSFIYFKEYFVLHPYEQIKPLHQQTHPVEGLPKLGLTRVDAETLKILEFIKVGKEKGKKEFVLALFDVPGLNYLFSEQYLLPEPWISYRFGGNTKHFCDLMSSISVEKRRKTLFVFLWDKDDMIPKDYLTCLRQLGYPEKLSVLDHMFSERVGHIKLLGERKG